MSGLFDTYKSYRIDGFAPNSAYNKNLKSFITKNKKNKKRKFRK